MKQSVWTSIDQRPGYLAPGARTREALPTAAQWPGVLRLVKDLERAADSIRSELLRSVVGTQSLSSGTDAETDSCNATGPDTNKKIMGGPRSGGPNSCRGVASAYLLRNGVSTNPGFEEIFPETAKAIEDIFAPSCCHRKAQFERLID